MSRVEPLQWSPLAPSHSSLLEEERVGLNLGTTRHGWETSDCPEVASARCPHPLVPGRDGRGCSAGLHSWHLPEGRRARCRPRAPRDKAAPGVCWVDSASAISSHTAHGLIDSTVQLEIFHFLSLFILAAL